MLNISFTESYFCSECKEPLEIRQMDELQNGNINVFIVPCQNCMKTPLPYVQTAIAWWDCECGYAMPEPLQSCVKCGAPRPTAQTD